MSVFEDLVVELKEENLLESTIIEDEFAASTSEAGQAGFYESGISPDIDITEEPVEEIQERGQDVSEGVDADKGFVIEGNDAVVETAKPENGMDFYRKRAMAEMSSLQMVEHVLTGVEREFLKVVPKVFDDFEAKRALNNFIQATQHDDQETYSAAEFALVHETEAWCTALAERDGKIAVSSIRHFCENARPALSSQAMVAMARFYRNLPHSEAVRAKFDYIITRLFSRVGEDHRRVLLFSRDEMLHHITTMYREWSSIPLYDEDQDETKLLLTALSFEDLANEAESASTFDLLVSGDFFGRLRMFKESVAELFYAPNVTAAAVESNIRIGNAFVQLIEAERARSEAGSLEAKYAEFNAEEISDAAGQRFVLLEILRSMQASTETKAAAEKAKADEPPEQKEVLRFENRPTAKVGNAEATVGGSVLKSARSMNRWVIVFSVVMLLSTLAIYLWSGLAERQGSVSSSVSIVTIEGTVLKDHLTTARISGPTMYGVLGPSWEQLSKEQRLDFLQAVYKAAQERGCTQVNLITKDGKNAAFASATRMDIE